MTAALLIRRARAEAGLTQAQLAARIRVPQSTIARLEAPGSNPRFETLLSVLAAAGSRLALTKATPGGVDETLVAGNLSLTPAERLERFRGSYRNVQRMTSKARRRDAGVA
jgi:transcriptional regulator with XRE-family HTH domain